MKPTKASETERLIEKPKQLGHLFLCHVHGSHRWHGTYQCFGCKKKLRFGDPDGPYVLSSYRCTCGAELFPNPARNAPPEPPMGRMPRTPRYKARRICAVCWDALPDEPAAAAAEPSARAHD